MAKVDTGLAEVTMALNIMTGCVHGSEILCEISKVPFEISHQIFNPYTAKFAFPDVLKVLRLMIF